MEFLKNVLEILDYKIDTPALYGGFHLVFLAAFFLLGIILCATHRRGDDERVRRTVFVTAIIVSVLEIYKQLNYSLSYDGDTIKFAYQWYIFPFQFCSLPMYAGLLTGIFRKGRVHQALMAFLATYAIFGGACVMFYPGDVFVLVLGINIQTMICHGSMVTVGIYLWYSGYVKASHSTFFKAMPVFAFAVLCAVAINELTYATGFLEKNALNLFFISPYCAPSLPVYSMVQEAVPYPWCLFIYFLGFSAAAYIIFLIAKLLLGVSARQERKIRERIYGGRDEGRQL